MSVAGIAVVGMACEFPGARTPEELWEDALAQRRAFRRMPPERLDLTDYYAAAPDDPDRTYLTEAALIRDYVFDRARYRVAGETYRAADPVHWLALDVAARALEDAGLANGEGLPRETTGVHLGNTLAGDSSRAQTLRLRWPYVSRTISAGLAGEGWSAGQRREFLDRLEERYKAPFAPVGAETLAGGLSNTIAGRVCNYFDFKGGGHTVDAACASSLLAVAHACSALGAGDLDAALAGGVDLSLDPFELVGFAKVGALASELMRIFDAHPTGFCPGEGCGWVVLMRADDARAKGLKVRALLRGWGISSDGQGGLTRPEVAGQRLALQRAYRRAGYGIETVPYFEGHGTGTAVGDATELTALSDARHEADPEAPAAAIGSIKANIGHTKAAAGIAGLIKAVMALQAQIVPPTSGCVEPHAALTGRSRALRIVRAAEPWPEDRPLRAGVSAMGFGGINVHVALEAATATRRGALAPREHLSMGPAQDAELFVFTADSAPALTRRLEVSRPVAASLSRAELTDLAAALSRQSGPASVRAAVVAASPAELVERLDTLLRWLSEGAGSRLDARAGVFLGQGQKSPRIGFLFPGQGTSVSRDGGAWSRRFESVRRVYREAEIPEASDPRATEFAQPAIVAASIAGLAALGTLGITAEVAIGHSLGELSALHWAGVFEEAAALRLARARGRAMADLGATGGAMASLSASRPTAEELLNGEGAAIAAMNSPRQTVISGTEGAVEAVLDRAQRRGISAVRLAVSHGFHSSLMAPAAHPLAAALARERLAAPRRRVISTVTGAAMAPGTDITELLLQQVTSPVRFAGALASVRDEVDLWIEVGPGEVLSGLAATCGAALVVALDAGGSSLRGLLAAAGAAFAAGASVAVQALFDDRLTRPFDMSRRPTFFANPCELAPAADPPPPPSPLKAPAANEAARATPSQRDNSSVVELVRRLVAERTELPRVSVRDDHRLLHDLHLNSITVSQLLVEATRTLGLPPPPAPSSLVNATVAGVARVLATQVECGPTPQTPLIDLAPAGVESWVRAFTVERVARPRPTASNGKRPREGHWRLFASQGHPLTGPLDRAFRAAGGPGGVAVVLPPQLEDRHLRLLLDAAHDVLARAATQPWFVLVGGGEAAAAFVRSLHLEEPRVVTVVLDVPIDLAGAPERVVAEALAATSYVEARYDRFDCRTEPCLRHYPIGGEAASPRLGPADVILATGGGKGIGAECALALARRTGARLAVLGRSDPATDPILAANLRRIEAAGVVCQYVQADVREADDVRRACASIAAELGTVTALIHAAGVNEPRLIADLDEPAILHTLAPKVQGFRNLTAAVDPNRLRLVATFGSVIARSGMRGEADYALANAWLTDLTMRFRDEHQECRCLALEWSVWSGLGMGERLGRIDALLREGVQPISPDVGASLFVRLVGMPDAPPSLVIAGRLGEVPTLRLDRPTLPPLRFLERPRVDYPGVEIVVEADLSVEADPYLDDHVFRGERLFPAVMGLEAMAQAAVAALPERGEGRSVTSLVDVRFDRPVSVAGDRSTTIRVAALVRAPDRVDVVLRSSDTNFQTDQFRASVRFGEELQVFRRELVVVNGSSEPRLPIDPNVDLYATILFHRGRFRRLEGYRRLHATDCLAELTSGAPTDWFGPGRGPALVLGDPGARDAAIHAVQACIPHVTLLPVGADRILIAPGPHTAARQVHARERGWVGDELVYDVVIADEQGRPRERWDGLRFKAVRGAGFTGPWPEALLGPYLERQVKALIPGATPALAVGRAASGERNGSSDRLLRAILGSTGSVAISRRPDGKPELSDGPGISAAHADGLTLVTSGLGDFGCDVEPVAHRPADVWRDLLGPDRFHLARAIEQETATDLDLAATRVWAAGECLIKLGGSPVDPLVLDLTLPDGWAVLRSGRMTAATVAIRVRGHANETVFAVAARPTGRSHEPAQVPRRSARAYEMRHVVCLEETNMVGNVYFVNHLRWQGRCREMFLRDHAPAVLDELASDLVLVTRHASCDYHAELKPFDSLTIRMSLEQMTGDSIDFRFEFWRLPRSPQQSARPEIEGAEDLVATGKQTVSCLRRINGALQPTPIPEPLRDALAPFL